MTAGIAIEPTRIAEIERRVNAIHEELLAFFREIEQWAEHGDAGSNASSSLDEACDVVGEARDGIHGLRVTLGRPGFSNWWFHRMHLLSDLSELNIGDYGDDLPRMVAVDKAVAEADPELMAILNKLAPCPGTRERVEALPSHGITQGQLQDRAEAVLSKLIDSGWRP